MLIAAAEPAPIVIHKIDTNAIRGWILPGARSIPEIAVKTTSDITRGFINMK